MESINNRIYNFLLEDGKPWGSLELLKKFFKMKISDEEKAEMIINPLLENDSRFIKEGEKWKAKRIKSLEGLPVTEVFFLLFYIVDNKPSVINLDIPVHELVGVINQVSFFMQWKNFDTSTVDDLVDVLSNHRRYVFVPYNKSSLSLLKKIYRRYIGSEPDFKTLSLRHLLKVLFPEKSIKNWENVAEDFNLDYPESETPETRVKTLASVFGHIIVEAQRSGVATLSQLMELSSAYIKKLDFSRFGFDRDFLKGIPEMPGVYIFRDKEKRIIYIGKASNLRARIQSYFWNTGESPEKMKKILDTLYTIEYRILGSELSALIEEYRLIKKYLPEINVKLDVSATRVETSPKILILPSVNEGEIELFFIADNIPLKRCEYSGNEDSEVISILKELDESKDYFPDPEKNIALSYFNQYEEFINTVEIDKYSGHRDILRVLKNFVNELDETFRTRIRYI